MKTVSLDKSRNVVILALLASLVLAIALFATAQVASAGGPVYREKDDIVEVLGSPPPNFCTGEEMEAYGDAVLLVHDTGAGLALHISGAGATMIGVDSGTLYRFNGALNEFESADDEGSHSVHHFTWFSPSNGDAFIATFVSHTTVDGNGNIAVDIDFVNGGCM